MVPISNLFPPSSSGGPGLNLQIWVSAVVLGITIGGAYYDLRSRIDLLDSKLSQVSDRRIVSIEREVENIGERQNERFPLFDRMVFQVDDHEKRIQRLEIRNGVQHFTAPRFPGHGDGGGDE